MRDIFAVGRGQYENIGDVLLRRPLLDWAREAGRLHVYVGASPEGYDEGLGLQPEDIVYRSFPAWYRALLTAAAAGAADSLYKPGEIQLTLVGMKEHIAMLPAAALVRARGGRVARIGAGARNFAPLPRALMWPSNALSNYTRWRDDRTADYLGFGAAMPDLGFSEGLDDEALEEAIHAPGRELLVVSLREDAEVAPRPYPGEAWFEGVRDAAERLGLQIVVVTQITVDQARSERLAEDLGAELVGWSDPAAFAAQERRLREVYRRTSVVVSDRLHVAIAGFTEGAAPVGSQFNDDDKIERHFSTIGVTGVAQNASGRSAGEISDHIVARTEARADDLRALVAARAHLHAVRDDLHRLLRREGAASRPALRPTSPFGRVWRRFSRTHRDIGARPTPPPTAAAAGSVVPPGPARRSGAPIVWHVGRAGDIPGGMTQVINAYLGWTFDAADVDVLVSRGDPGDHLTALRRFAAARAKLSAIAHDKEQPAAIVVHLSERGSFLREGHLARHAARLGLPVIAHLHGADFAAFAAQHPATVARVLGVSAHVISLSEESTEIAAGIVGADRVTLVPNAIPAGGEAVKRRTIVFGGVVSHRKGIDVLQEAWRRVAPAHPEWELLIAGPVRDEHLVDRTLPQARFLGSVKHDDLMALLDEAAVAVLPSRDEAMPMFILEALARRACVVSTTVGGIPAVLGDEHGVLTEPGDVDALARALGAVLAGDDLRERLADRGHARFLAEYSAEAVFPRVEQIWLAPLGAAALASV